MRDSATGEVVRDAYVYAGEDDSTETDVNGHFELALPAANIPGGAPTPPAGLQPSQ